MIKRFLIALAFTFFASSFTANTSTAATLIGGPSNATGIEDLVVDGVNYDLAFVDVGGSSFNTLFGTGTDFPWMASSQSVAEGIRDALAAFDMTNPFQANSSNDALNVYFGATADRVEFVNYWTSGAFSGRSFGPFSSSRIGLFSNIATVVQITSATPISAVPLPAGGLLLLSVLGLGGVLLRRRAA